LPTRQVVHVLYNPNTITSWFTSVMQLINNVTVLSVVLVGAAVIRERERGTIEHLLVMPVRPSEIAVAKIVANGLVILLAVAVSVLAIIEGVLGVPVEGSVLLFLVRHRVVSVLAHRPGHFAGHGGVVHASVRLAGGAGVCGHVHAVGLGHTR
jgi:ABC-type transport system involved in multi-copper enzyme maturation permease subunit